MSHEKAIYRCTECGAEWAGLTGPQLLNPGDGNSPACLCGSKYCQWLNYKEMFLNRRSAW